MKNKLSRFRILILNRGVKMWWNRLYVRKDEFHKSLSLDAEAMTTMTSSEQVDYLEDLYRRRKIAHERDLRR